jgi:mannose-6-phosphate isomerase-like protein (cupin superfamily)
MIIHQQAAAEKFAVHGVEFHSYARTLTGSHQLGAWQAEFPPQTAGVPHHMSVEEVFRVLSGRLRIEIGNEVADVASGDVVVVPARSRFRVSNESDDVASAWIVTPLGKEFRLEGSETTVRPPWAQ